MLSNLTKVFTASIIKSEIKILLDLCLNALEAHSAVLFLASKEGSPLVVHAGVSLSENFNPRAIINPGEGLVGWVYKNKQASNIDHLESRGRQLLYYNQANEPVRSFMAVPLIKPLGVLVVDSLQRYVFSDRSLGILNKFGQLISAVLGEDISELEEDGSQLAMLAGSKGASFDFWAEVEQLLNSETVNPKAMTEILGLLKNASGLDWAFLTGLLPGDSKHYYLINTLGPRKVNLAERWPLNAGLAGWVQAKANQLLLPRIKAESLRSYIFSPEEEFQISSFYGLPLVYGDKVCGGIFLASEVGRPALELSTEVKTLFHCLASRLAVHGHVERLVHRVVELSRLDSQTGLPHRSYFLARVNRLLEISEVKEDGVSLYILGLSGLGRFAQQQGQEAARDLLRNISHNLLALARPSWELGHVSYGILAVAALSSEQREVEQIIETLARKLVDWPLETGPGRVSLGFYPAKASYPQEATSSEDLLEAALINLGRQQETLEDSN